MRGPFDWPGRSDMDDDGPDPRGDEPRTDEELRREEAEEAEELAQREEDWGDRYDDIRELEKDEEENR